ncbi:MAG: glycosyltransferase family 2 protein [Defluviitaleaceae bacterium]|nr:glycosyltransferase family 2 protein [Defluviitaleaceae bacterium]
MSTNIPKISIVVPCYNEEEALPLFITEVKNVASTMPQVSFEYIFVDDGSRDATLAVLRRYSKENDDIHYLSFSRNFGKEAGLLAGLEAATGDYVAVMDADLQDPPSLLPQMYNAITQEGYDCAATRRVTRKGEPPIRSFFANRFYKFINKISDTKMVDGARDFRLMTRQMVDSILDLKEYNRFSKGLFSWVGYNTKWIEYDNVPRVAGNTKWNFWQLLLYSMDGIVAFSVKPLALASFVGFILCLIAFIGIVFIIVRWVIFGDPVAGWASTVSIVLFVGGMQLLCTGIVGMYLSKAYLEVKGRPIYVVKEKSE